MANNGIPHILQEIFPLRSNGAAGKAFNAAVVQDKARIKSARSTTTQPAAMTQDLRAPQMHKHPRKSPHSPHLKQNKVQLTLWVHPIVKEELQRKAKREGNGSALSVSQAGAAFLEKALQQDIDLQYSALLQPIIEQAIQKEMAAIRAKLSWLLVRVAFDSGQTGAIVTNILGRLPDITEEKLKDILGKSQKAAKGNLTRKSPQLTTLVAAVEHWLGNEAA